MAGTIVADTIQDGAGNNTAMDNAIYGSAKAWVNFNGVSGSVAIRASYNTSSVTRTATGFYTIAMTNAMTDANYSVLCSTSYDGTNLGYISYQNKSGVTKTSSTYYLATFSVSGTGADSSEVAAAVFR